MTPKAELVGSLGEFISLVSEGAAKWRKDWEKKRRKHHQTAISWLPWFRGEPSAKVQFPLRPTLYRRDIKPKELDTLLECEGELRVEFKRCVGQLMTDGGPPKGKWERYFLMQHYESPTRLLDWSDSALMALHFAIRHRGGRDDKYKKSNPVVYMLDPWSLNRVAFKDVTLASKAARPIGVALPDWDEAKPYLSGNEFKNEELGLWCPLAIDPTHSSRRIAAQRSRFTIFGRDSDGLQRAAEEHGVRLRKFEFNGDDILSLKQSLHVCGISESNIFPDLGGLGRELMQALGGYLAGRFPAR